MRTQAADISLANILPEELEAAVKLAAEISMGTEISESDINHIHALCDQVISISAYRSQLAEYLRNRMNAIAPNLTALVGELVGARLISHAGSLRNLAKQPASTVQILGAEKALFRALKTKHDTPKYGLIYHVSILTSLYEIHINQRAYKASLVGQAPQKLKGKMARMVATKAALSIRVDALSDADSKSSAEASSIGIENRAKLESRLRALEYRNDLTTTTPFKGEKKKEQPKFEMKTNVKQYNTAADAVGFLPTQRQGAEVLAINAVLDVKEEKRREKEEKRRAKEEKRKRKAEATAAAAAIEEGPESEPKDGMSFACGLLIHLTYLLDAISVPMETEVEQKERKKLKKEKKKAEAAAAADAAIAAAIASHPNMRAEGSEKKKSKKRKHDEDEMEIDGEKKKKKRRKE